MKIGFIGAGNMGGAILRGLLSSGFCQPRDIAVSEPHNADRGVVSYHNNPRLSRESDIILLCVKPFILPAVLEEIKSEALPSKLFISIAAGISTQNIENILGSVPVLRVMPNTPASLGWGMSALCAGSYAAAHHMQIGQDIFNSVGKTALVSEPQMDAVTALSGSGPAFFYYFTDAMIQSGIGMGLNPDTARLLACQTAAGAGQMLVKSGKSPETLISDVTTPGGTTAAGLEVLKNHHAAALIAQTLEAAELRSKELRR